MPAFANGLTIVGLIALTHAVYSAYEHALLASPDPTHNVNRISIPTDIVIETLVGTGALMMAIVSNSASLRPIHWAEWAGKIEREGWDPNAPAGEEEKTLRGKGATGNPYHALEERRGFWDVRKARKDFADWAKGQNSNEAKGS